MKRNVILIITGCILLFPSVVLLIFGEGLHIFDIHLTPGGKTFTSPSTLMALGIIFMSYGLYGTIQYYSLKRKIIQGKKLTNKFRSPGGENSLSKLD
jgi:hypothetical protein